MIRNPGAIWGFSFLCKFLLFDKARSDILRLWETREPGGLPSFIGGANPPDERKEGVANGYIF